MAKPLPSDDFRAIRMVFEAGGIRFKPASVGKSILVWCAQCGQSRLMSVEWKTTG
jgi:hypothetical protein